MKDKRVFTTWLRSLQRYFSVHSKNVKQEVTRNKMPRRSMGYAKTPLSPPQEFLKRSYSVTPYTRPNSAGPFRYPGIENRKPALPRNEGRPATSGPRRNFVYENAHHQRASSCRLSSNSRRGERGEKGDRAPKWVHTCHGDAMELENSGLIPKYQRKKDFGMVPKYIHEFVDEMKKRKLEEDVLRQQEVERNSLQKLDDNEKEMLLRGLKHNLGQLQCQYLNLSVIIDTPSKRDRKCYLESQISQLEKDINLLERYQNIYIMPVQ